MHYDIIRRILISIPPRICVQISSIRVSTHLDCDVCANMSGQYGDKWYVGVGCGSREVRRAVIAF